MEPMHSRTLESPSGRRGTLWSRWMVVYISAAFHIEKGVPVHKDCASHPLLFPDTDELTSSCHYAHCDHRSIPHRCYRVHDHGIEASQCNETEVGRESCDRCCERVMCFFSTLWWCGWHIPNKFVSHEAMSEIVPLSDMENRISHAKTETYPIVHKNLLWNENGKPLLPSFAPLCGILQ